MSTAPWVKGITVDSWELVAKLLPTPWPKEIVESDLAYWCDQVKTKRVPFPGRPALAKRWGWSDWQTRQLLEEHKTLISNATPTALQRPSRKTPTRERKKQDNGENSSNATPAALQRNSNATPTPNTSYTDITDIHIDKEKINKKETILPEEGVHDTVVSPSQAPIDGQPPRTTEGRTEPAGLTPLPVASRSNPGFEVPLESLAAQAVWQEHRKHHPKVDEKPSKAVYGIVKSAYKLLSGEHTSKVEQLVLLVEAANCCPDRLFSYDIRAIGWDGGTDRSGDLDTVFRQKRIPARLQAAKEWAEKGKLKENFFDNFTKKPQHNANSPPSENHFLNSLFGAKKPKNLQVIDAEFQPIQNTFFQIAED